MFRPNGTAVTRKDSAGDAATPVCIRHSTIHKATGLDSTAVILIGMPPHKDLATDYAHFSWFMAVSRARQLLAVVEAAGDEQA